MSAMFRITLPDGSVREVAPGTTPADIAAAIGSGLAKAAYHLELVRRVERLDTLPLLPDRKKYKKTKNPTLDRCSVPHMLGISRNLCKRSYRNAS